MIIRLYRINTGSCGGCDVEIGVAVEQAVDLAWADTPRQADALLLTGPATMGSRAALAAVRAECAAIPLLAIGRCAIDGMPFGKGGLADLPEGTARLQLQGCPPTPEEIAEAIREALR